MPSTKDDRLQIRVDPAEKRLLERAAAVTHVSVSAFVLQSAAAQAATVLADRTLIELGSQAAAAFTEALDAPATAEPAPGRGVRRGLPSSVGLTELRRPEALDPKRHDRSAFDSGSPELDDWLRRYASQNRRRDTAATWVITDAESVVVAYVSLSMTGIDRPSAPAVVAKQSPDPVPALLVGRLAVDRSVSGLGVGTALVAHVLATAVELNQQAACRAVVVTALDGSARSWWERLGFHPFDPTDDNSLDLYLLTADVEATLDSLRWPPPDQG